MSTIDDRLVAQAVAIRAKFDAIHAAFPLGMNALAPQTSDVGANWAQRDSAVFGMSATGKPGVSGFAKTSLLPSSSYASIGVGGFLITDSALDITGWATYADVQRNANQTFSNAYGHEQALKNEGADGDCYPRSMGNNVYGLWQVPGGDPSYGGTAANPIGAGWVLRKKPGGATAGYRAHCGFVFTQGVLVDISGTGAEIGDAGRLDVGMQFRWFVPTGQQGAYVRSDVATAGKDMGLLFQDGVTKITNTTGAASFAARHNDNGVNYLEVSDGVNGSPAQLVVRTTDAETNVDLQLVTLGTGVLRFGTFTTNADAAITGYVTIRDSSGTLRKLATIA